MSEEWESRWHWPTRVALYPTSFGSSLAPQIEAINVVRRRHASVVDFGGAAPSDLLLLDRIPYIYQAKALRGKVNGIAIFDQPDLVDPRLLDRLREASDAGFVVVVNPEYGLAPQFVDEFIYHQSHDLPLGDVLGQLDDRWKDLTYSAEPDALNDVRISKVINETIRNMRESIAADRMRINRKQYQSFGLDRREQSNFEGWLKGTEMLDNLAQASEETEAFAFDNESDAATGSAALGRASEQAESGSAIRYPDVTVFQDDNSRPGERITSDTALERGAEYWLEFAFRTERTGIEFDTEPEPLAATTSEEKDLLVAISIKGNDAEIPEPVQRIRIGASGDSSRALFKFRPTVGAGERVRIEVRVYCRFNLIEHVVASLLIKDYEMTVQQAQIAETNNRFVKYSGDLTDLVGPAALAIDVDTTDQGYRIVIAEPSGDELQLHAHPELVSGDLEQQLAKIRDCWFEIGLKAYNQVLKPESRNVRRTQLRALAEAGHDLWNMLFASGPPNGALRLIGNELRSNPPAAGAKISVTLHRNARRFVLPWQLLYDRDVPERGDIDPVGFWGMRYLVEQQIAINTTYMSEDAKRSGTSNFSMMVDGTISQTKGQRELLNTLAESRTPPSEIALADSRKTLSERLAKGEDSLYYFFCHGLAAVPYDAWAQILSNRVQQVAADNPSNPTLVQLRKLLNNARLDGSDTAVKLTKSTVPLKNFEQHADFFVSEPLIFLNMCESALIYPSATKGFVAYFLNRFAGAVIGTECPVPPLFADKLAQLMLPDLIEQQPAGEVLLAARNRMWKEYENPLGLAYSLWGRSETEVA